MTSWLTIIGIGQDGFLGLGSDAKDAINEAKHLFGGKRHFELVGKKGNVWESPIEQSFKEIDKLKGERVVILASGDPMWFGIGASLCKRYGTEDVTVIPTPSAFSLVASKMLWSLSDTECLTVHGLENERITSFLLPGNKLIILTTNEKTPQRFAEIISELGFGESIITVFSDMGSVGESRVESTASKWNNLNISNLNTVAIECLPDKGTVIKSRTPGLPDAVFQHDGQITKREVRAITLSALCPLPNQTLWDIGAGCGSICIEWLRSQSNMRAYAVERNIDRLSIINSNALALGVPELNVVFGDALKEIIGLPSPDAVFIGGGITSGGVIEYCWQNLKPGGRLVANAVTIEGEQRLIDMHDKLGGELVKIDISRVEPLGQFRNWEPLKPVTQFKALKP